MTRWWNKDGILQVRLVPGDSTTVDTVFDTGSHQDDVLRLQGTPTGIKLYAVAESAFEIWYYGGSIVTIDISSQCVTGWWNEDGNLRIADLVPGDNVTNSTTFTTGSSQDDVLRLQGMPTGIKLYLVAESAFEIWYYGDSIVTIDISSQCVTGWWNEDGNLRIADLGPGDNVTNSTTFTTGSSQDDVLRLQGMPTGIKLYVVAESAFEIWVLR